MSHISFSELKVWNECPFKHKLSYRDKIPGFRGNIFTAFGKAIHSVCEEHIKSKFSGDLHNFFVDEYTKEIAGLPEDIQEGLSQEDVEKFLEQGLSIIPEIPAAVKDYFGEFEAYSVEEMLYEPIKEFVQNEYSFKGYIDLVVKTTDGKYHIIDWKTTSWGWDARRRSDPMSVYQLVFYKHYFALKHNIDINLIETHFALLKRTAKVGYKVEFFKVTSGAKRTENALKLLNKALYNINNSRWLKNRTSCNRCEFYKTEHCP